MSWIWRPPLEKIGESLYSFNKSSLPALFLKYNVGYSASLCGRLLLQHVADMDPATKINKIYEINLLPDSFVCFCSLFRVNNMNFSVFHLLWNIPHRSFKIRKRHIYLLSAHILLINWHRYMYIIVFCEALDLDFLFLGCRIISKQHWYLQIKAEATKFHLFDRHTVIVCSLQDGQRCTFEEMILEWSHLFLS